MLMRIFRFSNTLNCPIRSIFQQAGLPSLMDPFELNILLNRLEFSQSRTSRFERRVRVGSTVQIVNLITQEQLKLCIVQGKKANLANGEVSFSSPMGSELLGLHCGDIVQVNTSVGALKWKIISVNHQLDRS